MKKGKKNRYKRKDVLVGFGISIGILSLLLFFSVIQGVIFNPIEEGGYNAFYNFDEGIGTDYFGVIDGTAGVGVSSTEGYIGNGVSFIGHENRYNTDYINLGSVATITSNEGTFGAMVYFNEIDPINDQYILSSGNSGGLYIRMGITEQGYPEYFWYANGKSAITSSEPLQANRWYHYVVTYADGIANIYIDGELVATGNGGRSFTDGSFYIGRVYANFVTNAYSINGTVDDVMILNRMASPTEIENMYAQYQSGVSPISNGFDVVVNYTDGGSATGSGIYFSGAYVELNATPDEGYIFTGWSGDFNGEDSYETFLLTDDLNVTANFEEGFIYYLADEDSKTCSEVFILSSEVTENHYSTLKNCEKVFINDGVTISGYTITFGNPDGRSGFIGRIWNWIISLFN